jgi:hypothetical protein
MPDLSRVWPWLSKTAALSLGLPLASLTRADGNNGLSESGGLNCGFATRVQPDNHLNGQSIKGAPQ